MSVFVVLFLWENLTVSTIACTCSVIVGVDSRKVENKFLWRVGFVFFCEELYY